MTPRTLGLIIAAAAACDLSGSASWAKEAKACPPGLAKKTPACVPPGLARKGVTSGDWQEDRAEDLDEQPAAILKSGDVVIIEGEEFIVIETTSGPVLRKGDGIFRLPTQDWDDYVRIGDAIVRVDPETKAVIELIRLVDLILS